MWGEVWRQPDITSRVPSWWGYTGHASFYPRWVVIAHGRAVCQGSTAEVHCPELEMGWELVRLAAFAWYIAKSQPLRRAGVCTAVWAWQPAVSGEWSEFIGKLCQWPLPGTAVSGPLGTAQVAASQETLTFSPNLE